MKDGIAIEKFDLLFDKKSTILELDGFDLEDPSCWLKLNPKLTGFYRVHYSDDLFQNLFQNLRSSSSHVFTIPETTDFFHEIFFVQIFNKEVEVFYWDQKCHILVT